LNLSGFIIDASKNPNTSETHEQEKTSPRALDGVVDIIHS